MPSLVGSEMCIRDRCLPVTLPVNESHAVPIVFVVCGAWLQFQSIAAAAVIPSALTASLMAPKPRASGKHARGSRTRAAGYKGRSGWASGLGYCHGGRMHSDGHRTRCGTARHMHNQQNQGRCGTARHTKYINVLQPCRTPTWQASVLMCRDVVQCFCRALVVVLFI